jgi:hypothetical protein
MTYDEREPRPTITAREQMAWDYYCYDTRGDMDVRDFWWELPAKTQEYYMALTAKKWEEAQDDVQ